MEYFPTHLVEIYGIHVGKYPSPMDPSPVPGALKIRPDSLTPFES